MAVKCQAYILLNARSIQVREIMSKIQAECAVSTSPNKHSTFTLSCETNLELKCSTQILMNLFANKTSFVSVKLILFLMIMLISLDQCLSNHSSQNYKRKSGRSGIYLLFINRIW